MQSFHSAKTNYTYVISLTYGRCELIKARCKIDLLEGDSNTTFQELWHLPKTRMDVLWEMIDQKSELPVILDPDYDPDSDGDKPKTLTRRETFDAVMEGQTLVDAINAFWEELCFFFQSLNPERELFLKQMVAEMKEISIEQAKAAEELGKSLEKKRIMSEAIQKAKAESLRLFEKESGELLANLGSTPVRIRRGR